MQESGYAPPPPVEGSAVKITDINMPFGSMVSFMLKWALASIPAMIILAGVGLLISAIFVAVVHH